MRKSYLFLSCLLWSLLFVPAFTEEQREIKILRQTPAALDRAISDHLCMSYEGVHPYHRCKEVYHAQGTLSQAELDEFDFIITTEQFYNEKLARNFELVLPLYQQAFTVVVRDVDQGELFSSGQAYGVLDQPTQHQVLADVLMALNVDRKRLSLKSYKAQSLIDQFCSFNINVAFVTGAHPDRIVRQLNTLCGGKPLSIVGSLPKNFFKKHRYFYKTDVPKELYWRLSDDIETLSIRYLLAVNDRFNIDELDILMDHFLKELEYNQSLPITENSILLNNKNLQTPLHEVGNKLIEALEQSAELKAQEHLKQQEKPASQGASDLQERNESQDNGELSAVIE